jgi:hypothetical protein
VTGVINGRDEVNGKTIPFVEFFMAGQKYKVTSREWLGEDATYNDLTLYMNGQRVFEIGEAVDSDQYATTYRPFNINAYVNDEWVSDFKKFQEHKQRVQLQASIEFAEDKKRLQETKEAFGIGTNPDTADSIRERGKTSPSSSATTASANKVGIWIVIAIFLILAVLWATR